MDRSIESGAPFSNEPLPRRECECLILAELTPGLGRQFTGELERELRRFAPNETKFVHSTNLKDALAQAAFVDRAVLYYHTTYDIERIEARGEKPKKSIRDGKAAFQTFDAIIERLAERGIPFILLYRDDSPAYPFKSATISLPIYHLGGGGSDMTYFWKPELKFGEKLPRLNY